MFSYKHNNSVFLDYTLDQLINSNVYLGYIKKLGNESMFRYLIGTRLKSDIINLNYTLLNLRVGCNFIYQVLYNYGYL